MRTRTLSILWLALSFVFGTTVFVSFTSKGLLVDFLGGPLAYTVTLCMVFNTIGCCFGIIWIVRDFIHRVTKS